MKKKKSIANTIWIVILTIAGTRLDLSDHYDPDELFEKRISDQYRNCI